jgi:chromosome segregation ATPase
MSTQYSEPQEPSFWKKLWRFLWTLLLIVLVVATIGAAVYFMAPFVYQEYIEPVQEHSFQLDMLAEQAQQLDDRHTDRMNAIGNRLDELELQNDKYKEGFAGLEERISLVETTQTGQLDAIKTLEPLLTAMEDIEKLLESIQSEIGDIQNLRSGMKEDIKDLQKGQSDLEKGQDELGFSVEEIQVQLELLLSESAQTQQEVQLIKVMELITRARYNLVQGNLSLARADIQSGRDIISEIQKEAQSFQVETLVEIATRLDTAQANLPGSPLSAADQLEAAWQMLIVGLPEKPEETPEPEVTITPTPTPTPTPTS